MRSEATWKMGIRSGGSASVVANGVGGEARRKRCGQGTTYLVFLPDGVGIGDGEREVLDDDAVDGSPNVDQLSSMGKRIGEVLGRDVLVHPVDARLKG